MRISASCTPLDLKVTSGFILKVRRYTLLTRGCPFELGSYLHVGGKSSSPFGSDNISSGKYSIPMWSFYINE